MTPVVRLFLPLLLAFSVTCLPNENASAFDEPMQSISTGNITGVYYAAGSAVAKMHNKKRKEYNLRLITETSEGSIANIENVIDGSAGFGIAQANALYFAQQGERSWEGAPQKGLRSVLGLYPEAFTIIAVKDGIQTLADLRGKVVNIGELGSTDNSQAREVFKAAELDPAIDVTIVEKPTYIATELLQSGDIDAYFYTVGHPNLSVKEAAAGERKIVIIPPGDDFIDILVSTRSYLSEVNIPIDYYSNLANKEPVPSVGVKAILFTNEAMSEEVVYRMVKEVFENFDLFKRQHPALAGLTPEKLTSDLIVPLHPGAERYFREAGILR